MIVRASPGNLTHETRIALARAEVTEFDEVTPAQLEAWYKDLGSPPRIKLVPREVTQ